MGAIVFAEEITQVVKLQSLSQWDEGSVDALMSPPELGSGTNFAGAIEWASDVLQNVPVEGNAEQRIVLLTDTQLDEETYQNQAEDLERVIGTALMPAGIQLVVVDYARSGGSEEWWDKILISRTGGWYMKNDLIGADESAAKTLCWAVSKPPEPVTLEGESVQYLFSVAPYQRQIKPWLTYNGEISATIHPPIGQAGDITTKDPGNGQIDLVVDSPVEGRWSITVGGTGTFKLFLPPISTPRNIELALSDSRQSHQALPVGTPVQVELILRDVDDRAFVIADDRFQVSSQLVDDKGSSRGALDVLFDRLCSCYRVTGRNVTGLEGQYYIDAQAIATWLSKPIVANRISAYWGRVPRFADTLQVNSPDLKIGQGFSVTVNLADLDAISYPPHIQLLVNGLNNSLIASDEMSCRQSTCYADVPALGLPGTYTLTAVLYAGSTKDHVDYANTVSSFTVVVSDLTFWELVNQNRWKVLTVAVLVAVLLFFLTRVFQQFQVVAEAIGSQRVQDPAQRRAIYTRIRREARNRGGRGK